VRGVGEDDAQGNDGGVDVEDGGVLTASFIPLAAQSGERRLMGALRTSWGAHEPNPCPIETATASLQGATAWESLRAIVPPYLEYDPPSAAVAKTWLGLRETAHGERIDLTQFTFKSERHTGSFGRYVRARSGTPRRTRACRSSMIELAACFHECNSCCAKLLRNNLHRIRMLQLGTTTESWAPPQRPGHKDARGCPKRPRHRGPITAFSLKYHPSQLPASPPASSGIACFAGICNKALMSATLLRKSPQRIRAHLPTYLQCSLDLLQWRTG
jgi:hypothetical protein